MYACRFYSDRPLKPPATDFKEKRSKDYVRESVFEDNTWELIMQNMLVHGRRIWYTEWGHMKGHVAAAYDDGMTSFSPTL